MLIKIEDQILYIHELLERIYNENCVYFDFNKFGSYIISKLTDINEISWSPKVSETKLNSTQENQFNIKNKIFR